MIFRFRLVVDRHGLEIGDFLSVFCLFDDEFTETGSFQAEIRTKHAINRRKTLFFLIFLRSHTITGLSMHSFRALRSTRLLLLRTGTFPGLRNRNRRG